MFEHRQKSVLYIHKTCFTNAGAPSGLSRTSTGLWHIAWGAICFWIQNAIHAPYTRIVVLWHISTIPPMSRVKSIIILVSPSCNRVFTSAESDSADVKSRLQRSDTSSIPPINVVSFYAVNNGQYTFVRYTKLVNEIGISVAKVKCFQLWQLSVTYTQYDMPPHPTLSKNCARYFTCSGMATLWSACDAVYKVNKWFADDVLRSVKGEFLPKSDLSC